MGGSLNQQEVRSNEFEKVAERVEEARDDSASHYSENKQKDQLDIDDDEPEGVEMDLGEGFPMDNFEDPFAFDMHD